MTSIQSTIRQPGRQTPPRASIDSARPPAERAFRWSRGFISAFHGAVALTLIASMLVLPGPVGAAETPAEPKPTIRVQVLLKSVYIWDDRDWGDGDMHFRMWLGCWAAPTPCIRFPSVNVDHYDKVFSTGSGDTYSLNAVLPGATDRLSLEFATPGRTGYSLFDGQRYELGFEMYEADGLTNNEDMGERHIVLQAENGWGIGDYSLRSTRVDGWGDYTINFEVRRSPLPRPPGPSTSKSRTCQAVR